MWKKLQNSWLEFKGAEPGRRFLERHERHRASRFGRTWTGRILVYLGAPLLFIMGVAMVFAPGPGLLVMVFAVAVFASEFRFAARALDWVELKLRPTLLRLAAAWSWLPAWAKLAVVFVGFLCGLAMGWFSWRFAFGRT